MKTCLFLLAASGCIGYSTVDDSEPTPTVYRQLTGSVDFTYAGVTGHATDFDFRYYTYDTDWKELYIGFGNVIPAGTHPACPRMAALQLVVTNAFESYTGYSIDVVADNTQLEATVQDPTIDPCPQVASQQNQAHPFEVVDLDYTGSMRFDSLWCSGATGALDGCALTANGTWTITGTDRITHAIMLTSTGEFHADDIATSD
ncbi:MAG: hypothetical protein QM831_12070 [Kofleriaceae bacterium]